MLILLCRIYQIYEGNSISKANISFQSTGQNGFNSSFSIICEPNTGILASTFHNTSSVSLGIPKNHSLTDSFLRSTMGCE